jgi:hypothetical protein
MLGEYASAAIPRTADADERRLALIHHGYEAAIHSSRQHVDEAKYIDH